MSRNPQLRPPGVVAAPHAASQYPIIAVSGPPVEGSLTAPASRSLLGYGPVQFLGVFDTLADPDCPEKCAKPWQEEVHRALQPVESPGGVTLRWSGPRNTQTDAAGVVQTLGPAFENAIALSLYVGGLDLLQSPKEWNQNWPGQPIGATPFAFSKAVPNIPTIWQTGLSFTRPRFGFSQTAVAADSGDFGLAEMQDGFRWLRNVNALPALDLLSYIGAPWAEADLWELAGGTRYVAAWLRLWWSRFEGANTLADVRYHVPWVALRGRAAAPCHRDAWHTALPIIPASGVAAEGDVYTDGARYQLASPISGAWRVGAENNGDAGDNAIFVGLELRGSTILSRAAMSVNPLTHGTIIGPTANHGGAAVISAGYQLGGQADAMLIHVAVAKQ